MYPIEHIKSRLDSLHLAPDLWDGPGPERPAGVLIPLIKRGSGYNLVFTQRADHLPKHPGQISFPGGSVSSDDDGPADAALRETREEIGVPEHRIKLFGRVGTIITPSGFRITSFVGEIESKARFKADPSEVAEIFEAPFAYFMNPDNHGSKMMHFRGRDRHVYEMPWNDRYIWGVTAQIIKDLYDKLRADD